ncbi:MAG: hypothetical protein ACKESB_01255 [Candidatus Hodgkinia cicadicola]
MKTAYRKWLRNLLEGVEVGWLVGGVGGWFCFVFFCLFFCFFVFFVFCFFDLAE